MSGSFHFRSFNPLDLTEMYIVFLDAFSDYPVGFKLTKEQFVRKFVEKLKIDFSLSIGAYDLDVLAGFVFTSINYYEGQRTAYNGGTGVRPSYRGNQLTARIYEYLIPKLETKQVKQCVLEVLTENDRAIKAYEKIGFEKTKHFKCFKLNGINLVNRPLAIDLNIYPVSHPRWSRYEKFVDYAPSFLDSSEMISENLANEVIIEAHHDNECVGYVIFQPAFGRISQIAVHPGYREKGIGSKLVNYVYKNSVQQSLTVINVNEDAVETVKFFEHIGFENQLDQYEMILTL